MNRQELIESIATQTEASKKDTARFVDSFTAIVQDAVLQGQKVKLAGFGTFEKVAARARVGRNPRTGQEYAIEATNVPKFTPSDIFKDKARASGSRPTSVS